MGMLLMQCEYQRASREYNACERNGARLNNQLTRYTKRVEKMESLFDKAKTRIGTNLNTVQNQAASQLTALTTSCSSATAFNAALGSIVIGGIPLNAYIQCAEEGKTGQDLLTQLSSAAAQARTVLSTLIEAVKEAEEEKLDAQRDEQLTPISEKESDLQAEVALNDTLCDIWKERRDAAKQRLGEDIKNGVAHYGLG